MSKRKQRIIKVKEIAFMLLLLLVLLLFFTFAGSYMFCAKQKTVKKGDMRLGMSIKEVSDILSWDWQQINQTADNSMLYTKALIFSIIKDLENQPPVQSYEYPDFKKYLENFLKAEYLEYELALIKNARYLNEKTPGLEIVMVADWHKNLLLDNQPEQYNIRQQAINQFVKKQNLDFVFKEGSNGEITWERAYQEYLSACKVHQQQAISFGLWKKIRIAEVDVSQYWDADLIFEEAKPRVFGVDTMIVGALIQRLGKIEAETDYLATVNQKVVNIGGIKSAGWAINIIWREKVIWAQTVTRMVSLNQKQGYLVLGALHLYYFPYVCWNFGTEFDLANMSLGIFPEDFRLQAVKIKGIRQQRLNAQSK